MRINEIIYPPLNEGWIDNLKSRTKREVDWITGKIDRKQVNALAEVEEFADNLIEQELGVLRARVSTKYLNDFRQAEDQQKKVEIIEKFKKDLKSTFLAVLTNKYLMPFKVPEYTNTMMAYLDSFVQMTGSTVEKIKIDYEQLRQPIMSMISTSLVYDTQRDQKDGVDPENADGEKKDDKDVLQQYIYDNVDYGAELGEDEKKILGTNGIMIPVIIFYNEYETEPQFSPKRYIKINGKWYVDKTFPLYLNPERKNVLPDRGIRKFEVEPTPISGAKETDMNIALRTYMSQNQSEIKDGKYARAYNWVVQNQTGNRFQILPKMNPNAWKKEINKNSKKP